MKQLARFSSRITSVLLLVLLCVAPGTVFGETGGVTFDFIGSALWTGINDIETQGNYAYVTMPHGLVVLDLSNPAAPSEVGRLQLEGQTRGVGIGGGIACVASSRTGMQVVDISNPEEPTLLSVWYESKAPLVTANDVAVIGDYAYLMDHYRLYIIDISNPYVPVLVDEAELQRGYHDLQVVGNYAYGTVNGSTLAVLDISDPATYTEVGLRSAVPSIPFLELAVVGDYAYVACDSLGLQVIDISNPISPTLGARFDTPGRARDVTVWGSFLFVADQDAGMTVFYVSDPAAPSLMGTYLPADDFEPTIASAWNGYVLTRGAYSRLDIVDMGILPAALQFEGQHFLNGTVRSLDVVGDRAYVGDNQWNVHTLDITDPANPTVLDHLTFQTFGAVHQLIAQGDYLYLALESGVAVHSMTNPQTSSWHGLSGQYVVSITVENDLLVAYTGAYDSGDGALYLYNINNPLAPEQKSVVDQSLVGGGGIFLSNGFLYVGGYLYTSPGHCCDLDIFEVSDPREPTWVGVFETAGAPVYVTVQNDRAYVLDTYYGLRTIDVSDPSSPLSLAMRGGAYGSHVSVANNVAYVSSGHRRYYCLKLYDLSGASSRDMLGTYITFGIPDETVVVGDYVYVADTYGLSVIQAVIPAGACCLPDGSCLAIDQHECEGGLGGEYLGVLAECLGDPNGNGTDDVCEPTGACCSADGSCRYLNQTDCEALPEGTYLGDGSYCLGDGNGDGTDDVCEPPGTCCLYDGSCVTTDASECILVLGGTFLGSTSECLGDLNENGVDDGCEPAGACCLSDGSCTMVIQTDCEGELQGTYQGDYVTCRGDGNENGVDDACEPKGACCYPAWCSARIQTDCEADPERVYHGDGTSCLGDLNDNGVDDLCEPTGACCLPNDECLITRQTDCETTLDGEYLGDGAECLGDTNSDGFDDACVPLTCCVGRVGDANGLGGDEPTIGDVSVMIDAKFITGTCEGILDCFTEADINQSGGVDAICDDITIGDISILIDYLFIGGPQIGLQDCL